MTDEAVRDRKFRHELVPLGAPLVNLADAVLADLLAYEERFGLRQRRRKRDDHDALVHAVHVIAANLAYHWFYPPDADTAAIILPMGHPRTKPIEPVPCGFGDSLKALVETLHAIGVLILAKPQIARWAHTIVPTAGFLEWALVAGVSVADIGRRPVHDRLRLSEKDRFDRRTYHRVPDTIEAQGHRDDLTTINRYLASAAITYLGNTPVDVDDRTLVRHFNIPPGGDADTLDYGGRLFGGFWQPMSKDRRRNIRIGGEPLVELDYGQIMPRLAYAAVGAAPPENVDLYHIPEIDPDGTLRDGIKKAFSALFYGTRKWTSEIAESLDRRVSANGFRQAVLRQHPALTPLLQPGCKTGYRLMNAESQVMVAVLLDCIAAGIVALPIHDAVLVPQSAQAAVVEIMQRAALRVAGAHLPVSLKG